MKRSLLLCNFLILLFLCCNFFAAFAQISYGGKPYPLKKITSLSSEIEKNILFVEMPPLQLTKDEKIRFVSHFPPTKSLEFAHKFRVRLNPENSGSQFITAEGMKIWRVGIRSKNALSLNLLFTKFHLPPDAKVFVYNSEQTEILGAFTSDNQSEHNLLPVQPISSDEIIVEYQEPENALFKGEIEIGEINHDFIGILRAVEPNRPNQSCHPNIICHPDDLEIGNGIIALIINGTTYCTGVLVNNSRNDATPYLLTATHCLNNDYNASFLANRKYDVIAESIVAFFNYQSPICNSEIRGTTQMTLASADSVLISEKHDISLLKFKQNPPPYFQPYYLGWNVSNAPQPTFHGVHHPNGGIKKIAIDNDALNQYSFDDPRYNMTPNAHWAVQSWNVGATEAGSSGSPLLDKEKRIVGTLTGGYSMCSSPKGPDFYASLHKAWNATNNIGNPHSLSDYLNPNGTNITFLNGLNPYSNNPHTKSANFLLSDSVVLSEFQSVPLFATNNQFGFTEFAEEFQTKSSTQLDGVFITSSTTKNINQTDVYIRIYDGKEGKPSTLLYETPLDYSFQYFNSNGFLNNGRNMNTDVENFVRFENPITVSDHFFISYYDKNQQQNGFNILSVAPRKIGTQTASTAWIKSGNEWTKSSANKQFPINSSLLIAPYVIGKGLTNNFISTDSIGIKAFYDTKLKAIIVQSNKEIESWKLFYSSGGQIVANSTTNSINSIVVSAQSLHKGVYIILVKIENKLISSKVLIW